MLRAEQLPVRDEKVVPVGGSTHARQASQRERERAAIESSSCFCTRSQRLYAAMERTRGEFTNDEKKCCLDPEQAIRESESRHRSGLSALCMGRDWAYTYEATFSSQGRRCAVSRCLLPSTRTMVQSVTREGLIRLYPQQMNLCCGAKQISCSVHDVAYRYR